MHHADLPHSPCYLNGRYLRLDRARVSVMDRGFLFGDGVYEVIPAYEGRLFCFEQHIDRRERSLEAIRLTNPHSRTQWRQILSNFIAKFDRFLLGTGQKTGSTAENSLVYLQVTRGVALRDHALPADVTPTVFAMCSRLRPVSQEVRAHGATCVSANDIRWHKAHIKSTSLLGAVLSRQVSADVNAQETILFRDDTLTEASSSNVWVVKDGAIWGTPRNESGLEGIRYGLMERLCRELGLPFGLRPLVRADVERADELLLTSASKEVLAVTRLDGKPVGNGLPGPIYDRLFAAYQLAKQQPA